ncbi:hypothetical protein [Ensifer sp.]|uniref:hypothetical protein n=1 Tax=Ensifer sp. TaxID=1872086 RepID=UPI002E15262E|nr:hypothetical protein [Ensifer sp.]
MPLLATVFGAMNEPARMISAAHAKKIAIDLPMDAMPFEIDAAAALLGIVARGGVYSLDMT